MFWASKKELEKKDRAIESMVQELEKARAINELLEDQVKSLLEEVNSRSLEVQTLRGNVGLLWTTAEEREKELRRAKADYGSSLRRNASTIQQLQHDKATLQRERDAAMDTNEKVRGWLAQALTRPDHTVEFRYCPVQEQFYGNDLLWAAEPKIGAGDWHSNDCPCHGAWPNPWRGRPELRAGIRFVDGDDYPRRGPR